MSQWRLPTPPLYFLGTYMGGGDALSSSHSYTGRKCAPSAMSRSVYLFSLGEFTMQIKLTAVFQKVPEGYIGFVEELPGANTQGDTLEEARNNLEEAVQLVLKANRQIASRTIIAG